MAEHGGGSCNVVLLNLDRANSCRSRLPRPLGVSQRRRSHQTTRSQLNSPTSTNSVQTRLKFPQLAAENQHSKIPQPNLTLRTNINNSLDWARQRPKTSVIVSAYQQEISTVSADRRKHQLKSIQEPISRRNSSDEQAVFARFTTLPAIGVRPPNSSHASISLADSQQKNFVSNSPPEQLNMWENNGEVKSPPEMINDETGVEQEMEYEIRPLIRSETYDILPTLNEEDATCDDNANNVNDKENESDDDNEHVLSAVCAGSVLSNSSEDDDNVNNKLNQINSVMDNS